MSDKVDVDVEVSGWTKEQTAFALFDILRYQQPVPTSVEEMLGLYAKCQSVVRYGYSREYLKKLLPELR